MNQDLAIPSFNTAITVDVIFASFKLQQSQVQFKTMRLRQPAEKLVTDAKLLSLARKCHRGFQQNLKACKTMKDHVTLHRATTRRLAQNFPEYRNAAQ